MSEWAYFYETQHPVASQEHILSLLSSRPWEADLSQEPIIPLATLPFPKVPWGPVYTAPFAFSSGDALRDSEGITQHRHHGTSEPEPRSSASLPNKDQAPSRLLEDFLQKKCGHLTPNFKVITNFKNVPEIHWVTGADNALIHQGVIDSGACGEVYQA